MKILVLGATGRVGYRVVKLALKDGHKVTAFVRETSRLNISHPNLSVFIGNALKKGDILSAVKGQDAVISALSTDRGETLSKSAPLIIEAMKKEGLKRIITIGTAGILNSRENPDIYRYQSSESKRSLTRASEEHKKAFEYLYNSNLNWTVICPTYMPDGNAEGRFRIEANFLPKGGEKITAGDTAEFAYSQLFDDSHIKQRIGIAY
ncbi:NAD(P)-dependent oxidoreductase [Scopulibacillus cellulosilyticus]|uniref:NAD(P)-dependent oxidoreductase n=1 Tax=Scopulibacillus cellulosilyticus TaxID=2665665 RepID=A0ABW2PRA0_9BACL